MSTGEAMNPETDYVPLNSDLPEHGSSPCGELGHEPMDHVNPARRPEVQAYIDALAEKYPPTPTDAPS